MSRSLPDLNEESPEEYQLTTPEEDDGSLWWGGHEDEYEYTD